MKLSTSPPNLQCHSRMNMIDRRSPYRRFTSVSWNWLMSKEIFWTNARVLIEASETARRTASCSSAGDRDHVFVVAIGATDVVGLRVRSTARRTQAARGVATEAMTLPVAVEWARRRRRSHSPSPCRRRSTCERRKSRRSSTRRRESLQLTAEQSANGQVKDLVEARQTREIL